LAGRPPLGARGGVALQARRRVRHGQRRLPGREARHQASLLGAGAPMQPPLPYAYATSKKYIHILYLSTYSVITDGSFLSAIWAQLSVRFSVQLCLRFLLYPSLYLTIMGGPLASSAPFVFFLHSFTVFLSPHPTHPFHSRSKRCLQACSGTAPRARPTPPPTPASSREATAPSFGCTQLP
jgi:hypothetical protein